MIVMNIYDYTIINILGVGPAAATGEPHVDMVQDRETHIPIGARGTIHLTAGGSGAEREFRVAPVELTTKLSSADKTLRVADHCLQVRTNPNPNTDTAGTSQP